MKWHATTMRDRAAEIWQAGVEAVDPERAVGRQLRFVDAAAELAESPDAITAAIGPSGRLIVIGGGKAAVPMLRGVIGTLESSSIGRREVTGLISVPADCVTDVPGVRVVAGRPAGVNEPTDASVAATRQMIALARSAGPED